MIIKGIAPWKGAGMQIDQRLLAACDRGDERAQYQLYKLCYQPLYAVCRRYADDDDRIAVLLNTSFLKVIKSLRTYQATVPFEGWIKRIAINTAIDAYRKDRRYRETIAYPGEGMEVRPQAVTFNEAAERLDAQRLLVFVRSLPHMTNKVFNLYAMDGYTHREIAEMLNIQIGTSKWHLAHARARLQEMIAQDLCQWDAKMKLRAKQQEKLLNSN